MSHARDQAADAFGPVYAVTLPVNTPFTGRYALFQPAGEKTFPNFEDHILIRRRLGEQFQVTLSAFVPFDEEPMRLWDNPEKPQHVVLYQRFYLAFSNDGGTTFRRPTSAQQNVIGYGVQGRWSRVGILEACIAGSQVLVKTCLATWHDVEDRPSRGVEAVTWGIPIEGESAPVRIDTELLRPQERGYSGEHSSALLQTDGAQLWARSDPAHRFVPVPLTALAQTVSEKGQVDFFGGSGARSFF